MTRSRKVLNFFSKKFTQIIGIQDVENKLLPKYSKKDGEIVRQPVNIAEYQGIERKKEKNTVWNNRRHVDHNILPSHLRTMTKRLLGGQDFTEVCLWECDRFTLLGKFCPKLNIVFRGNYFVVFFSVFFFRGNFSFSYNSR